MPLKTRSHEYGHAHLTGGKIRTILTFTATCNGVVPSYCSASISTETTLGPVTMVIGGDMSRWELSFQNLNILMPGEVCGNEGGVWGGSGGRRLREGGEVTASEPRNGWTAVLGIHQKARFFAAEPSSSPWPQKWFIPLSSFCCQILLDSSIPREMETKGFCTMQTWRHFFKTYLNGLHE